MTLRLDGVSITLHGRPLVPALSAEVAPGEVLAVMGPSGSGKSSLLAWLAGLLEPPMAGQGRLLLDGVDISGLPVEQRRIGLLFQDDLLFPHMSVLDNLLFALPAGASRSARVAGAMSALAAAGLDGLAQRRPHQLSGGQRSRVSLLRTLLARPAAVLLDEPFSRLDAALRGQLRDFVWRSLRERGVPAVLVTHDEQDVPPGARCLRLADLGAGRA
jgi:putative thiamine transport system ATP-binding protein